MVNSTSPYLQQHADNPVDWFTWGEEAFNKARRENKPILLSIGYSACHWCHVMAHESFEDETTAALMNRHFVNIKVDREERPDIDKIYQLTHSLLIRGPGGWPLTTFIDPKTHAPFFSGTYFPDQPRHHLPAFKEVLVSLADYFNTHLQEIRRQGEVVCTAMQRIYAPQEPLSSLPRNALENTCNALLDCFDTVHGGFGEAPKFPQPSYLEFLIYYWVKARHQPAIEAVVYTLNKMSNSGVYDHIGGGFYRYAVDREWMIPHFEKMLYDNGWLLSLLSDAAIFNGAELFKQRVCETAEWVMREMQSSAGGYYSSIDADSEGKEGWFYVWSQQDIDAALQGDGDAAALIRRHYNLGDAENFEGKWHLHLNAATDDPTLATVKKKLFDYRNQRIKPHLDNKILTAWNALMIKGMAKAAMVANEKRYADSAQRAFRFMQTTMWDGKQLRSCWNNDVMQTTMYLDDCAFLLDTTLYLLQMRWDKQKFSFALSLADILLEQFEDKLHGGYFFTPDEHEILLQRPRTFTDEAVPCGYGIATSALILIGLLSGYAKYLTSAERALGQANRVLEKELMHCTTLVRVSDTWENLPEIIILRGAKTLLPDWQYCVNQTFNPQRYCFAIPSDAADLPPAIADKPAAQNFATVRAYICQGTACQKPIDDLDCFRKYLGRTTTS